MTGSKNSTQKMGGIAIIGTGSYVPEKVLTNFDLEKIVDTSDEWITTRTGIKERRIASPEQATSDLAYEAAKKALKSAHLKPEEIDLIVVATITPDVGFPATACYVQHKLGAVNAVAFDLSAACTGIVYALSVVKNLMIGHGYRNAIVIGAEVMSRILNWSDRNTCVLFGDGAGAIVLQAGHYNRGLIYEYLGADGSAADLICIPSGGSRQPLTPQALEQRMNCLVMEGKEVYKFAVRVMGESIERALTDCEITSDDVALMIPHQANIRIIKASADKFKIPYEKVFVNMDRYGNTSGASIGIALDEAVRAGRINRGDIIILVAFGSGLTWGSCVIRW
jgi:3-oxoacyl-[acyl-carrier-protein] synthase-3